MIHSDEKWEQLPGEGGVPDGECCVEKRGTAKGVGEVRNENDKGQVSAEKHRKRKGWLVVNEIEEGRKRMGVKECARN